VERASAEYLLSIVVHTISVNHAPLSNFAVITNINIPLYQLRRVLSRTAIREQDCRFRYASTIRDDVCLYLL